MSRLDNEPEILDPDADEMRDHLKKSFEGLIDPEESEFEIEEAIYWFANDFHGGQGSNLYSALSTSEYSPGPITSGPQDTLMYDELVAEFAPGYEEEEEEE